MINMMTIFYIGIIIVILIVAGFTYIVFEKIWDEKVNIKQNKCSNFTETPKFYYLIEWRYAYSKTFPQYNKILVGGDVSEVRKQIKELRKKYKDGLKYMVYEQRVLTNFINWE